jgi:DNA-binding CsgD family transcriptional regulator
LAAARCNVLSVDQIAARLADRFRLLITATRTAPQRQHTLRATLDWSYGLLSPEERLLFDRLGVFAGDCTLEAVEVVCAGDGVRAEAVVDLLARLVDKSLVVAELAETMRYKQLETMRHYGREHLLDDRTDHVVRARHADFYVRLAERQAADFHGPRETAGLSRLEREYENIRAALDWLISTGDSDRAQRMAAALWWFWVGQQQWEEGRSFLERVAALPSVRPATRAVLELQYGAATIAWRQGDYATADRELASTLVAAREAQSDLVVARVLVTQAQLAIVRDECLVARRLAQECLATNRATADRWCEGRALETLSELALREGDYGAARQFLEQAISLARSTGDRWSLMRSLLILGDVARSQGDYQRAAGVYTECLEVSQHMYRTPLPAGYESLLHNLGYIALHDGDADRAEALFTESLSLFQRRGNPRGIAECLIGFATVAAARGRQRVWAVRLFAAADAALGRLNAHMSPSNRADYERSLKALGTRLGQAAFDSAWSSGRMLSLDDAVGLVTASAASVVSEPDILPLTAHVRRVDPLTARECEVAQLVARGLTNRQIADQLVIAEATAERHLANIREKLGFSGRAQIAAWAVEAHLAAEGVAPLQR